MKYNYNIIEMDVMLFKNSSGASTYWNSHFGGGSGGVFLDDVHCSGSESRLIDCRHNGIGVHSCDHTHDVGVKCAGMFKYIGVDFYIMHFARFLQLP